MTYSTHSPGRLHWRTRSLLAAFLTVVFAACGNLTAGGFSEAEVSISGDAMDPAIAPATIGRMPRLAAQEDEDDDDDDDDEEAEGELEAYLELFLESEVGERVPLTDSEIEVEVDLQGANEFSTGTRSVPADRYTALYARFTDVEVEIEGGLVVDGQVITGRVDVEFEAEALEVILPVDLRLDDGDRVEFLLDLNAQNWLSSVDPDLQVVAETFFANAIQVRVR